MDAFLRRHADRIVGHLTTTDRLIFKGSLTRLHFPDGFARFLAREGVLLKDFGPYVSRCTTELREHLQSLASKYERPLIYLRRTYSRATGRPKEEEARKIAERDGIREGLICILAALEPCMSFQVRGDRKTQKLRVQYEPRKCLHYYLYYHDQEFGFMHVRVQSWFPFTVQVYINGREWLSRQMDRAGIGYQRYDNTFTRIDDLAGAERLCDQQTRRRWPRVLDAFARRVNPLLPRVQALGLGGYYWTLDQCEVATDVMFRDRRALEELLPDLFREAALRFSAEDVLRFLGRKLSASFAGEATTDRKRRPEGYRIKHRMKRNSVKFYDKASVLRIETTINQPREFRVLRVERTVTGSTRRWVPMSKGVANFWRYLQVGAACNRRYLDALGTIEPTADAVAELDDLWRAHERDGRRVARINALAPETVRTFEAALAGEHFLNGFRNRDLCARLYGATAPPSDEECRRRCGRISRRIRTLRDRGLVAKVPRSRRYRVTERGFRLMCAALHFRNERFPAAYAATA
jgi:hypothetical protein